jgi:signal transduction histidine kinase
MPIDVTVVLGTTAALLSQDGAHSGVHVSVTGHARPVMADAELLKIVFINLLVNSAQAMKGYGTVTISVAETDGACTVVVGDSGPGIPAEVRDRLFTPFVTTKARGTGLGLSTVKRIVEAHHGHVKVESPAGGGTRVTVRLPLVSD